MIVVQNLAKRLCFESRYGRNAHIIGNSVSGEQYRTTMVLLFKQLTVVSSEKRIPMCLWIPMFSYIGCANEQSSGQTALIQNLILFDSKYHICACVRACSP